MLSRLGRPSQVHTVTISCLQPDQSSPSLKHTRWMQNNLLWYPYSNLPIPAPCNTRKYGRDAIISTAAFAWDCSAWQHIQVPICSYPGNGHQGDSGSMKQTCINEVGKWGLTQVLKAVCAVVLEDFGSATWVAMHCKCTDLKWRSTCKLWPAAAQSNTIEHGSNHKDACV